MLCSTVSFLCIYLAGDAVSMLSLKRTEYPGKGCSYSPMEHPHRASIACALLRSIGVSTMPIEPVESCSNAVWLTAEHVVHYHVIGPSGRLEHEARVAGRLPADVRR